ncbi:MAG TPA: serine/threonine-protein kinase [Polyangiaceae bacterium]|nr:serine/threonine-protein kinase [Polyangiaceae bacterium]
MAGLAPGTILDQRYRVTELLGSGGMGEVYEAEHLRLGRRFAIKVLKNRVDQQTIERFEREARAIARLDSEFVVGVVDAGVLPDETPFLVMERLVGSDLRALLTEYGQLPIRRAVACIEQACRGIAAAHRASVVHRDLKPENLFVVSREDGVEQCKVLDFGVAKLQTSEFTQQGAVIGTIKYMAPEQLTDSASVGPATDIYALGAILFECLTGAAPHDAASVQQTMFKILNQPVPSVRVERPDVPAALDALLQRAMARDPGERFRRVDDFARALRPFGAAPSESSTNGPPPDDVTGVLSSSNLAERSTPRRAQLGLPLYLAIGVAGTALGFVLGRVTPAPVSPEPRAKVETLPAASIVASAPAEPATAAVPAAAPSLAPAPVSRSSVQRAQPSKSSDPPPQLPGVSFVRENPYAGQSSSR